MSIGISGVFHPSPNCRQVGKGGRMGNKASSRQGLDKDTMDFLVKNTKFTQDMIKVGALHLHCSSSSSSSSGSGVVHWLSAGLPFRPAHARQVHRHVQPGTITKHPVQFSTIQYRRSFSLSPAVGSSNPGNHFFLQKSSRFC
jgi:hypothetical protein